MRIAIAADHNAVSMKSRLSTWLSERGHQADDRGVRDAGEVADYPPLCADVGFQVVNGDADFGVILGGSGCGEQIAAKRFQGCGRRSATACSPQRSHAPTTTPTSS